MPFSSSVIKKKFGLNTYHIVYFNDRTYGKFKTSKCHFYSENKNENKVSFGKQKFEGKIVFSGTAYEVENFIEQQSVEL